MCLLLCNYQPIEYVDYIYDYTNNTSCQEISRYAMSLHKGQGLGYHKKKNNDFTLFIFN